MVVVDGLHGDAAAAGADALLSGGGGGCDLQAFFEQAGLEVTAAGGGEAEPGEEEEEELEWLSNKDAFPAVETMAPKPPVVGPRAKGARRRRRAVAWSPPPRLPPRPPAAPAAAAAGPRWCRHCGTTKTPQWREGPEGRATLCNACGVRYRTGRLVPEYRPVNSPTFSPELHSNIHRRVVEMRLCRGLSAPAAAAVAGDK